MSSILSDISEKLNIDDIKQSLSNVVNSVRSRIGIGTKSTDENIDDVTDVANVATSSNPAAAVVTTATVRTAGKDRVKDILWGIIYKIRDYIVNYGPILLRAIIYIMLASFVANDMIIYPSIIRSIFFIGTLFITSSNIGYAIMIGIYYGSKYGWDYYNKNLSTDEIKPPKSFPTIFAVCPLTTTYFDSKIKRFFLWLFMYQKADNIERRESENNELIKLMEKYWNDLNESFEYISKVKDEPHIAELYKRNKENLTAEKMHPITRPHDSSSTLPDVISHNEDNKKIQMVAAATAVAANILGKTAPVIPSVPIIDTSEADTSKADTSEADTSEADTSKADTSEADTPEKSA